MEPTDRIVVLAGGRFPHSEICLGYLEKAHRVICCDEAADKLLAFGREPDVIIGDLDSVSPETLEDYPDRIVRLEEQETNDLTKAVNYCHHQGYSRVIILGATGLREDHALGNISLLLEYSRIIDARMVSDYGELSILKSGTTVHSYPGEQVSFFSADNRVRVRSEGLKYPLEDMVLHNWWRGSLNEVSGDCFTLYFESEWPLILFRMHPESER